MPHQVIVNWLVIYIGIGKANQKCDTQQGKKGFLYTNQLFMTREYENFTLEVPGALKMTSQLTLAISEDFPKANQVILRFSRKGLCSYEPSKIRDFREGIVIYSFYMDFSFLALV